MALVSPCSGGGDSRDIRMDWRKSSKGNPMLRAELRKIGILHTATALFLVVMGMLLPSLEDKYSETECYQVFVWVYVALVFFVFQHLRLGYREVRVYLA